MISIGGCSINRCCPIDNPFQMVKVWYEPPPYGPGTSLNRPAYGHQAGGSQLIQQLSRRPQGMLIAGAIVTFSAIAYIPISKFHISYCIILGIISTIMVVLGVVYLV